MSASREVPPGYTRLVTPEGRVIYNPGKGVREYHKAFLEKCEKATFPNQFVCVEKHLNSRFFLKLDIKSAFEAVTQEKAEQVLGLVFGDMGRYFFHADGGLIQGAPASSWLFNAYCATMDLWLEDYCSRHGIIYSRYVDDVLFSSHKRIRACRRKDLRLLIRAPGFEIKEQKEVLVDNKFQEVVYLGIRIVQGKPYPTKEFLTKYAEMRPGTPQHKGCYEWLRQVLALGDRLHYHQE